MIFSDFLYFHKIDQSLQSSFSDTRRDIPDLFFCTIRARSPLSRKVGVGSYRSDFSEQFHCSQDDNKHFLHNYGSCLNDVRESEISPDATFLKRTLNAKLETGKTQNFTPRVGTANSITWWISISSSQVHEKCMKTEFSPELERVWFRSFRVCSACI